MLFKLLILSLAAQLAAGVALDYSPKPINLDTTELQRRAACAVPGVVNGQCGRYYRGSGCGDQIAAIDPGVSISFRLSIPFIRITQPSYRACADNPFAAMHRNLLLLFGKHWQHQGLGRWHVRHELPFVLGQQLPEQAADWRDRKYHHWRRKVL